MADEFPTADRPEGYESYFGLAESPFTLTSSPRFLFESDSYRAAFKEIFYALSRREQMIVVTGPIGTGKTTLCRMIDERKDRQTLVAVITTPPRSIDDLFRQVLDGFDLLTEDTKSIVDASRYGLQRVIKQFLDSLAALNAHAILVFDEAHHLGVDVLEEIRLLLNLDIDRQRLQIVLVGQPELDELLKRPELEQIEQRISRRHRLRPLQLAEVSAYVDRRLNVAQSGEQSFDRPRFTEAAMQAIATLSAGVPRVVNVLCDRALENAWVDKTHTVDAPAVIRAARALSIDVPPSLASPAAAATPPAGAAAPAAALTSDVKPPWILSTPTTLSETSSPEMPPPAAADVPASATLPPARVLSGASTPVAPSPLSGATPPRPFGTQPKADHVAGLSGPTSVRLKRSHVPIVVGGAVVGVVLLGWFAGIGRSGAPSSPASPPEAVRPTPSTAPPVSSAPRPATPPAASDPGSGRAAAPATALSAADNFLIIVSSFRTRDRAAQVAMDITGLGLPASVRTASGWEQVVVGPYASRDEAVAAQARLVTAHYADTKVAQSVR